MKSKRLASTDAQRISTAHSMAQEYGVRAVLNGSRGAAVLLSGVKGEKGMSTDKRRDSANVRYA